MTESIATSVGLSVILGFAIMLFIDEGFKLLKERQERITRQGNRFVTLSSSPEELVERSMTSSPDQ